MADYDGLYGPATSGGKVTPEGAAAMARAEAREHKPRTVNPPLDERDRNYMAAHLGYCDALGNVREGREIPNDVELLRAYSANTHYWSNQNLSSKWRRHWKGEHKRAEAILEGIL
jgi:hypothetical protein